MLKSAEEIDKMTKKQLVDYHVEYLQRVMKGVRESELRELVPNRSKDKLRYYAKLFE